MRVCKRGCVNFFSLKLAFWARKIRILESIFFAKQELIRRSRLRVQDFATGKNFSINQNYIKFVKSDWLSTDRILALIGQLNRAVRVTPK